MTINFPKNLDHNLNKNIEASFFISALEKQPCLILENIFKHLEPKDLVNFLCTCRTSNKIYKLYKKEYILNFRNLMIQIHFNFFKTISVSQLSIDLLDLYKKDKIDKITLLSKFLKIYKKFDDFSIDDLGLFFELSAGNGYADLFKGIIDSNKFQEISIDQVGIAMGLASDRGHFDYVKCIVDCNRFQEIPLTHIAVALNLAANENHRNIVEYIKNCSRYEEIPTEQIMIALENYID